MNDAFGHPQSIVVLGGTSEIARNLVELLAPPRCRSLVLAGRDAAGLESAAAAFRPTVARVETVAFDADDPSGAEKTVAACVDAAGEAVDLVVVAVGDLGDTEKDEATAGSSYSPRWRGTGSGVPTSSTAPPKPASTRSRWVSAKRCEGRGCRCTPSVRASCAQR
jgi:NAD(P)-dependent dehydrogenase (short-subunit alcohol dehydrogenase family)